jgi:tetratricopeptide (TPR) repeat protein
MPHRPSDAHGFADPVRFALRPLLLAALLQTLAPAVAPGFPTEPKETSDRAASAANAPSKERVRAEKAYRAGYDEAMEAKKLSTKGETAKATERFGKALTRFEEAVGLDEGYAEAWNMIGYCARHVGDLKRSFDAYHRALEIDPDLQAAHEYLGMAYVQAGDLEKAREQLAWLQARESKRAKDLAAAIDGAGRGAGADSTGSGAAADSTGAAGDSDGW